MFNMTFTDAQGVTHTDAVIRVRVAYHSNHSQTNYQVNADGTYAQTVSGGQHLTFSAEYWPDQAKFNAGRKPYRLFDLNDAESFNFNPMEEAYQGLGAVEACELYLETVLLQSLSQA